MDQNTPINNAMLSNLIFDDLINARIYHSIYIAYFRLENIQRYLDNARQYRDLDVLTTDK